ncbi:hypothetical protein V6N12_055231 [Hibiscus sabdariffa]|uniref:Uncharacterized protein n=1 Tax=Hibiscus sabdariffa TaxID=183260 RepID=A0ABR2BMM4_9ROSI
MSAANLNSVFDEVVDKPDDEVADESGVEMLAICDIFEIRSSQKQMYELIIEMKTMGTDHVLEENGFQSLLFFFINSCPIYQDLCWELMESFDVQQSVIEFEEHNINLSIEAILGMKNKGVSVQEVLSM